MDVIIFVLNNIIYLVSFLTNTLTSIEKSLNEIRIKLGQIYKQNIT